MNRRRVLQGLLVGGVASLAGCNGDTDDTDNSGEDPDVSDEELPEYVFENDVQAEFVDIHRQSLQEATEYRIEFTDSIETQETLTKNRTESLYSQQVTYNGTLVQEQLFYIDEEELVSRYAQGDSYQYSRVESAPPDPSEIVEESRLKDIIAEASISLDSFSQDIATFTGFIDLTYTSPEGEDLEIQDATVEVVIDTAQEVIMSVLVESETVPVLFEYTVSNIGANSFEEPSWISEVPDTIKAVSGGFYREGDIIILQNSDQSQLSEGMNLLVITPSGTSVAGQLQQSISSSGQAYLAFNSTGGLDVSINELPETQNRQPLERGTYIIIGTVDGEQVFELQLSNRPQSD